MAELVRSTPTRPATTSRRTVTALVLTALVVTAIAGSGYWLSHPTSLETYGSGLEATAAIGHTIAIDTTISATHEASSAQVTLHSLKPRITENTSDATVVFVVCQRNAGDTAVGTGQPSDLAEYCTRVDPLPRSFKAHLGFTTNQIVALVTPRKAGRLHIAGYDATYRTGLRRGTQHVGLETTVTT
ncbi:MAG TPA: hypothetical protein VLL08_19070 [Kineosporiaceae bacterium]|nr:hypothetical protein [Kineosporiaceae bacterium]